MPYTATQLTAYYTSLTGVAPDASTALLFQAYQTQNSAGTLSDAQTLANVFNSVGVQATFEVAQSTYQFFTGATTTAAGLAFLEGLAGSGNTQGLTTAYYNGTGGSITSPGAGGFNVENRYYNFAVSLASAGGAGNASFSAAYGSLTFAQTVAAAYENIVGTTNVGTAAANAAIADISSRQAYFQQVASTRGGDATAVTNPNGSLTLKAVVVGYILEEANKAGVGTYAKALDQFEASVAAGNAQFNTNLLTTYTAGGTGFNTGVGLTGQTGTVGVGQTFALTTGTDILSPTTGNATIVGLVDSNNTANSTLTAADVINAQGANNTLIIDTVGAPGNALNGASITGVQTLDIRSTTAGSTAAVNASQLSSATNLNAYQNTGGVQFTNVAANQSVGFVGNSSTAAQGTLTGGYQAGVTSATVTLTNGVNGGNLNGGVNLFQAANAAGTQTLATLNVISSGAANGLGFLQDTSAVTTLNITANTAFATGGEFIGSNTAGNAGTLTTVNVNGSGNVALGTINAGFFPGGNSVESASITTFTSTDSGGVSARFGAPTSTNAAGGNPANLTVTTAANATDILTIDGAVTGASSFTLGGAGSATTVTGADSITFTGTLGAGATVNGGGGSTIGITNAQFLQISGTAAAGNFTAAQSANITGFGTVSILDALQNAQTYDITTISGATNLTTVGVAAGGTATLDTLSGGRVAFTNALNTQQNTGTLNVVVTGAAASATDVLNIAATGQTINTVTVNGVATTFTNANINVAAANVETINFSATRSAAAVNAGLQPTATLNLTDAAVTNVTISGSEQVIFGVDNTGGAGSANFTKLASVVSTSTNNVTINVAPLITGTAAAPITVTTGAGSDTIIVHDFTRITTGAGTDTVISGQTTNGNSYSSILDASAGDSVNFVATPITAQPGANGTFTAVTAVNNTKIVLQSTAAYQDYLDAAIAQSARGTVSEFDFGGNTFLVDHNSTGALTYQNGADSVVQLIGIHTTATALTAAGGVSITS